MSNEPTRMGRQASSDREPSGLSPLGKHYFIGIGINSYTHWPPLSNAVRDVSAIARLLKTEYGFRQDNMRLLLNQDATEGNIINLFEELANQVTPTDSVLVYYAGHGHLNDRGRGFWVPVDAPEGSVFRYIRNSTIKDYIGDIKSLHTLLISDSCFSGSLFSGTERASQLAADELSRLPSRWAICSGRHDEAVADGPSDGNSPFAESILDVLRHNKRPAISAGFLVNQVIDQTRSNYDQLPDGGPLQNVGHKRGQFIFRRQGKEGIDQQWQDILAATDDKLSQLRDKKKLLRQFITDYPENEHINPALALGRQLEQKRSLLESWDSEFGLIAFLRQDSPYRAEAQARLEELRQEEEQARNFATPAAEKPIPRAPTSKPTPPPAAPVPVPSVPVQQNIPDKRKSPQSTVIGHRLKNGKFVKTTNAGGTSSELRKQAAARKRADSLALYSSKGFVEIAKVIKKNLLWVTGFAVTFQVLLLIPAILSIRTSAISDYLYLLLLVALVIGASIQSYRAGKKAKNYKAPVLIMILLFLFISINSLLMSLRLFSGGALLLSAAISFVICLPGLVAVEREKNNIKKA